MVQLLNDYPDTIFPRFSECGGTFASFVNHRIITCFIGGEDCSEDDTAVDTTHQPGDVDVLERFTQGREENTYVQVDINPGSIIKDDMDAKLHRYNYNIVGDHINVASKAPPKTTRC